METRITTYLLLLSLTGCFYGKVSVTSADRSFIPYGKTNQLVFVNTENLTDTLFLIKSHVRTSNFDFFIDRNLGRTSDRKKPYYESYASEPSLKRSQNKTATNRSFIKYSPLLFS